MRVAAVVLAVVSAIAIAAGAGLWFLPAGIITAGVLGVCAAYLMVYLGDR